MIDGIAAPDPNLFLPKRKGHYWWWFRCFISDAMWIYGSMGQDPKTLGFHLPIRSSVFPGPSHQSTSQALLHSTCPEWAGTEIPWSRWKDLGAAAQPAVGRCFEFSVEGFVRSQLQWFRWSLQRILAAFCHELLAGNNRCTLFITLHEIFGATRVDARISTSINPSNPWFWCWNLLVLLMAQPPFFVD